MKTQYPHVAALNDFITKFPFPYGEIAPSVSVAVDATNRTILVTQIGWSKEYSYSFDLDGNVELDLVTLQRGNK